MPTLDEYLGGIFNSIAAARTMADIQTVDMAEKYAKHELLKHFAVPHMRIADVEVMIPVAIERAAGREVTELDPIGNAAFKQIILDNIRNIFDPKNLSEEVLAAFL